MKRIFTAIIAIAVMGITVFAQNAQDKANTHRKESRTEISTYLASLPDVRVTYLTKSMLQRLPKNKAESPLGVLADKSDVHSVRVFELGNTEAETVGKNLINAYISEWPIADILMLQKDASNEVLIQGSRYHKNVDYYHTILMYSKMTGMKTILIIISGNIEDSTIGELIDSFSK